MSWRSGESYRPAATSLDTSVLNRIWDTMMNWTSQPARKGTAARVPYVYLTIAPLVERFRLGEGMLLAVNGCILWFGPLPREEGMARLALSAAVLAVIYALNNLVDCEADRPNPKKNQRLVQTFIEHRRGYAVFLAAAHTALVTLGLAADTRVGLAVAATLAVNLGYSMRAKGTPGLDLVVVAVWGGSFAAIASTQWSICGLVGLLTLLMHVFQMDVDGEVDAGNRVRTSSVAFGRTSLLVAFACVGVGAAILPLLGGVWAASAVVPAIAYRTARRTQTAWAWSRLYAGVTLLASVIGSI